MGSTTKEDKNMIFLVPASHGLAMVLWRPLNMVCCGK
jgi:hypothetical protein